MPGQRREIYNTLRCLMYSSGLGTYIERGFPILFRKHLLLDKAPRLSISIVIWILSSVTICQLNQFNTNSEAAMLSICYRE